MKVSSIIRHGALLAALTALAIGTVARTSYAQQDPGLILRPSEQGTQDAFSAQAEEQLPEPSIHAETTVVNLDVLVTDHDGIVLSGFRTH